MKEVKAIREVFFSEWLANTVAVKKKNGKWRVCVDFTDLGIIINQGGTTVDQGGSCAKA